MTKILIVDDSPVDRRMAGRLLEKRTDARGREEVTGLTALYAASGEEALAVIERERPEAVVTDLQMPGIDGLELVLRVKERFPLTPVVLMTAHGNEDTAVRALQAGAASYVPKKDLARELVETVEAVLEAAHAKREQRRLLGCLRQTESHFVLDNDPALIPPLVGYLKESLAALGGFDESALLRISMALREAVLNAMEHGNLELDSSLRWEDETVYHRLGQERRRQAPYKDRRVTVVSREAPGEAVYVVRDEGPGFDLSKLPDPLAPSDLERVGGRGLLLIRTFMTEVRHSPRGNEVTMVRRADASAPA